MRPLPKFSYNVTRDYPQKWFTPVAIVGGIILTALFSAINLFSTAYTMVSVTTDRPQDIETGPYTGSYAHLFASKFQPKCDDAVLAVGSSFITNQSLFEYQLISTEDNRAPALSYHNQALDGCAAYRVRLDFSTWYNRPAEQINISVWGLVVTVDLRCSDGPYTSDLMKVQVQFDILKELQTDVGWFKPTWVIDFEAGHGSAWALVLMLAFWEETITAITNQSNTSLTSEHSPTRYNLSHGYVDLGLRDWSESSNSDMREDNYFSTASWVFFDAVRSQRYVGSRDFAISSVNESFPHITAWPQIWGPVDRLAKAILSAIFRDLGSFSGPHSGSMLSDADTLRYWPICPKSSSRAPST